MTFKEAQEAFINRLPVSYQGTMYKKIMIISFQYNSHGELIETATLEDVNGKSWAAVPIKEVERWQQASI